MWNPSWLHPATTPRSHEPPASVASEADSEASMAHHGSASKSASCAFRFAGPWNILKFGAGDKLLPKTDRNQDPSKKFGSGKIRDELR